LRHIKLVCECLLLFLAHDVTFQQCNFPILRAKATIWPQFVRYAISVIFEAGLFRH